MNKFQFGTIMPQSTPVGFQYKPLGLEAFAMPLAMKQQRFDTTFDAIDQAKFDISTIDPNDSMRGKNLTSQLEEAKNTLLNELDRTGNYAEAARKLKEINKIYNEDPEIAGIRKQTAGFNKVDKEQKERIDGDSWTTDDYRKWKFKTLIEYGEKGGYAFDPNTGDHNSINLDIGVDNLEKEFMDKAWDIVKSTPIQMHERLVSMGISNSDAEKLVKLKEEQRPLEQVAEEVFNFMSKGDRYVQSLKEKAERDYIWDSRHHPQGKDAYNELYLQSWKNNKQSLIDRLSEKQDKSGLTPWESNKLNDIIADLDRVKGLEPKAIQNGLFEELVKNTFIDDFVKNWSQGTSVAASDLVNLYKQKQTLANKSDDSRKNAKQKIEDVNKYLLTYHSLPARLETKSGMKQIPLTTGGSTVTTFDDDISKGTGSPNDTNLLDDLTHPLKGALAGDLPEIFKNIKDSFGLDKAVEEYNKTVLKKENEITEISTPNLDKLQKIAQDFQSLLFRRTEKWNKRVKEPIKKRLDEINESLNSSNITIGSGEYAELISEKNGLEEELMNADMQEQGEYSSLNNRIFEYMNNPDGRGKWLKEVYNTKGWDGVYQASYDEILKTLKNLETLGTSTNYLGEIIGGKDIGVSIPPTAYLLTGDGKNDIIFSYRDDEGNLRQHTLPSYREDEMNTYNDATIISDGTEPIASRKAAIEDYQRTISQQTAIDFLNANLNSLNVDDKDNKLGDLGEILFTWRNEEMVRKSVTPTEVMINENLNNVTNNQFKALNTFYKEIEAGAQGAGYIVDPNFSNRTIEKIYTDKSPAAPGANSYNLDNYKEGFYLGNFNYAGNDVYVSRFTRPELSDQQIAAKLEIGGGANEVNNWLRTSEGKTAIKNWRLNNPKELFLAKGGTNLDFDSAVRQKYIQTVDAAMKTGLDLNSLTADASVAYANMEKTYATMNLLDDSKRSTQYTEMSIDLNRMLKAKDPYKSIYQSPNVWSKDALGNSYGYALEYKYDAQQNKLIADVLLITEGNIAGEFTQTVVGRESLDRTGWDAVALRRLDIRYGSGSEGDVVIGSTGMPFSIKHLLK